MADSIIAFIGAGNMASALIQGLLTNGTPAASLRVSDLDEGKLRSLRQQFGIQTEQDNQHMVAQADIVVLAVKPQSMKAVCDDIRPALNPSTLLISIAAGIELKALASWLGDKQALIRCMPNTPALVQSGASALFANAQVSGRQKQIASDILGAVGTVCWLQKENDMDAVTALSGSGPAYFFLLMEAMQEAAVSLGLSRSSARDLCVQTALGAAKLAASSELELGELRRQVTSPGGTTEAALRQFESEDFRGMVSRALSKAAARSQELARQLAGDT